MKSASAYPENQTDDVLTRGAFGLHVGRHASRFSKTRRWPICCGSTHTVSSQGRAAGVRSILAQTRAGRTEGAVRGRSRGTVLPRQAHRPEIVTSPDCYILAEQLFCVILDEADPCDWRRLRLGCLTTAPLRTRSSS